MAAAAKALAALPDGAVVLIDGLAGGALPGPLAAEAARLDLVMLVHHPLCDETGLAAGDAERLRMQEAAALRSVRSVVCTSQATARRLASGFGVSPAAITVAPPGTERADAAKGGGDPPRILSVGSLIPRKRHDVLIDALAQVSALPWKARIVGSADHDPHCAADLAARIAGHGLAGRIELGGSVESVAAEMASADIFALASEYEGYGMAFAEALAHGLPIVGCEAPAMVDLIPQRAGHLVRPGDVDAFASALKELLEDAERRADMARASHAAGRALPSLADTAALVAAALDRVPA